eukprot:8326568-Prorocentrum_lima.AAC.1
MTSSLVGSEMCIRDSSSENFLTPDGPDSGVSAVAAKHLLTAAAMQNFKGCLLYTSDAADDM